MQRYDIWRQMLLRAVRSESFQTAFNANEI